jgi:hypothetical protein
MTGGYECVGLTRRKTSRAAPSRGGNSFPQAALAALEVLDIEKWLAVGNRLI